MRAFAFGTALFQILFVLSYPANAADLAPPVGNFHVVTSRIMRSARPSYDALAYLSQRGVKTIIDLENDPSIVAQEADWAGLLGMQLISKPMDSFRPVRPEDINQILGVLNDTSESGILVHCMGGQDRTGLVIGLYRVLIQGWQPRDAHSEMTYFGFHTSYQYLEQYFRERTGFVPSLDFNF